MSRPAVFRAGSLIVMAVVVVAVLAFVFVRGRSGPKSALESVSTEKVERRDISVTVEATGTVEPINLVEVKSKASGQIVRMPVEIGSSVKAGDLLVQVDPRDVQNAYDQAEATLVAAKARAEVTAQQRRRADDLFAGQVITATEHESAMLDEANAVAQLVTARTNLDIAKQRLDDATVRAPIDGTVLDKPVAVGQVISSATSSVSGGTVLLSMADLSRIRMRAMVVETDIGRVQPGQNVTVVVDAYPQRSFHGTVEKIEPQALVQQSVTMFPVLISISNEDGLLLPGMNGEVTMMVDEVRNALSVPLDALRSPREMGPIAEALGLDMEALRAGMRGGVPGGGGAGAAADPGPGPAGAAERPAGAAPGGAMPDSGRGMRRGGPGGAPDSAQIARWRARRAAGGGTGQWSGRGGGGGGGGGGMRAGGGAGGGTGGGMPGAGMRAGGGRNGARAQVAVVKTADGYQAKLVRVGISDFDYAEVRSGLEEGDEVLLLGVLEIQQQRSDLQNRVRERMGGGVTGGSSGGGRGGGR